MSDKNKIDSLKKEEYHTAVIVDGVDVRKSAEYSPLHYLGTWDFIVVFLAVFLRFLVATNIKQHKMQHSFI